MQNHERELHSPAIKPVEDPNTIDVRNDYFRKTKPGEEGLKQVDKEVKEKTAAFEAYMRRADKAKIKATPPTPASSLPK